MIGPHTDKYFDMYIYHEYIAPSEKVEIQNKLSHNREFKVGPYYVGGYIASKCEIIEYTGCFYYFCKCIDHKIINRI